MSFSLFTELPQELIGLVLVFLKDDIASLRSCTLISRPWSEVSRTHLFRSISAETSRSISSFAALINTFPSVGPLVQNLVLGHNPSHYDHEPLSEISLHILATLLLKLPNLNTLRLSFLDFSTDSRSSTPANLPSPVSLGLLELNYLKPRDIKQLFTVLHYFAEAETFKIENLFVVPFAGNCESSLEQAATWDEDDDENAALHPLEVGSLQIRFSRYGVDRSMRYFTKSPSRFVVVEKVASLNMELPLCLNKGFAANLIPIFGPGVSKFDLDLTKQRFGNLIYTNKSKFVANDYMFNLSERRQYGFPSNLGEFQATGIPFTYNHAGQQQTSYLPSDVGLRCGPPEISGSIHQNDTAPL